MTHEPVPEGCMAGVLDAATDEELERLIAPDGVPVDGAAAGALPPDTELVQLYETMLVTRGLDEEFVNLQRQGQLALFPSCRGQEAAQVGCAAALRDDDWLFPQYRELGVFVVRGIDPGDVGLAWRGAWHGGLRFVDRAVAPMSIPIGTHALHAVGAAMAAKMLGEDSLAVAFVGDGATSEGDFHEALNFAAVYDAPCVFYVQNNHWAISVPVSEQMRAPTIAHKGIGYGIPAVRVDGNDVLACRSVVHDAARRARAGDGPTLIEAVTYRLGAHTTSDDPTRYRSQEEVDAWEAREPIRRYQRYLEHRGIWSDEIVERATVRAQELRTRLREAVSDAPDPSPVEVFDHVFARRTSELERQAEQLADELERQD